MVYGWVVQYNNILATGVMGMVYEEINLQK